MTLELEDSLRPLQAFMLHVALAGPQAAQVRQVAVHFTMVGMDMRINRFELARTANKRWRGQAILPVCSTGRQDWSATVEVLADQLYTTTFPLRIATR